MNKKQSICAPDLRNDGRVLPRRGGADDPRQVHHREIGDVGGGQAHVDGLRGEVVARRRQPVRQLLQQLVWLILVEVCC